MSQDMSAKFQDFNRGLTDQSAKISQDLQGKEISRVWMVPEGDWDPFQPSTIAKLFDRSDANQSYQDALHQGGAMGQASAAKVQIDHLARHERAFRLRHTQLIRAALHAAARRKGHGNDAGVHVGVVQQYVQDLLKVSQRTT